MKESKQKICKIPGCNKEVYTSKSLFCGEHERAFKEYKKIAVGAVGVAGIVVKFIAENVMNKKS